MLLNFLLQEILWVWDEISKDALTASAGDGAKSCSIKLTNNKETLKNN